MALSTEAKTSRKLFRELYSKKTAEVIQNIARGRSSQQIADRVGMNMRSVAATKANLTRGCYSPFANVQDGQVIGVCQF